MASRGVRGSFLLRGNRSLVSAGNNLWTPANLDLGGETKAVWYDIADSATVLRSGTAVYQVNDKFGLGNYAFQTTGSKQPVYDEANNELDFIGTDNMRVYNDPFRSMENPCVIALVRWTTYEDWGNTVCAWKDGQTDGFRLSKYGNDTKVIWRMGGIDQGNYLTPSLRPNVSNDFLYSAWRENTNYNKTRHNGTQTTGRTVTGNIRNWSGESSIGGVYLDVNDDKDSWQLQGSLSEIIVAEGLSSDDIIKIEGYMAWKKDGGVAGTMVGLLPSGHTWKDAAPTN